MNTALPTQPGAILYHGPRGPVRLIAGASGEGDPPAAPPAQDPPPADPPADPPKTDPPAGQDTTDWKAEARKWENRAKENSKAAAELEKARQASMSDQEKALAKAQAEGRTAAAVEFGEKLAASELKAAAAIKGVDLSEIGEYLNPKKFVGDDGAVDTDAITKAVGKLAKLTNAKPPRASGDFAGGTGAGAPITEEQLAKMTPEQIAKAHEEGKLQHLM